MNPPAMHTKPRFRWLVIAPLALAGLLAGALLLGWDRLLLPSPPAVAMPADIHQTPLRQEPDGSVWMGGSFRGQRQGVHYCLLAGPPEWRGPVLADLLGPQMIRAQAASLSASQPWFLRSGWRAVSRRYFPWYYGRMVPGLPKSGREELAGLALRLQKKPGNHGDFFSWLAYQASPEASGRAWGFGSHGLLVQQFESGPSFRDLDQEKVVSLVKPVAGLSYIAVGPPGLVGVIAAMNDAGIGILVIPGPGRERNPQGVPASLLARRVMVQHCSLATAAQDLQSAEVFAPVTFLLASGTERRVIAVEKTVQKTCLRSARSGGLTAVSFFQSQALAKDPASLRVREESPDARRLLRLRELLERAQHQGMNLQRAAEILRDTQGAYGLALGYGHPSALQSFQVSQAVIFDLAAKTAWVSRPPSPTNEFVPFTFDGFPKAPRAAVIPADPAWPRERLQKYWRYDRELREAGRLLEAKRYQECLALLQEAHPWNPYDYRPNLIAGRALLGIKHWDEAAYNLGKARRLHPAFQTERVFLDHELKRLKAKNR